MKYLLLFGLALIMVVGCLEKDDDDEAIILEMFKSSEPNWDIWDKPGAPQALYQEDAIGDNPLAYLYGSTSDWTLLAGTYDWKFAYIKACVPDILDSSGNVLYVLFVDIDRDGLQGPDDLVLEYDALNGYRTEESGIEAGPQEINGIQFAIPRNLLSGPFFVTAYIIYFNGLWQQGDMVPDAGNAAVFQY